MNTDVTSVSQYAPVNDCLECQGRREGFQIYTACLNDRALLAWDVELASKLCADRTAIRLHHAYLDEMFRVNRYNPLHLEHVDPAQPGIACVLADSDDSGPVLCLVDGTHRAAVCRRDGLPFLVYLLTPEESLRCQHTAKVALYRAMAEAQGPSFLNF